MGTERMRQRNKLIGHNPRSSSISGRYGHVALERSNSHDIDLKSYIGNAALQRLLAQRAGDAPFDLDDATAGRIHRARSGGQALDGAVQVSRVGTLTQTTSGNKHLTNDIEEPFSKLKDAMLNHGSTL